MSYRKETGNEYLWKQMGLELETIRLLLIGVVCDRKYNSIMPKATMQKLDAAIKNLERFRESAELRMNHIGVKGSLYDYCDDVKEDAAQFQQTIKGKAVPKLNLISAADLQRMSDEELAALSMKEGD